MNKEYIYKDGKALIIDDNDNQINIDYYDNLPEVLIIENIIEELENIITDLEDTIRTFKNDNKFLKRLYDLSFLLTSIIVPLILPKMVFKALGVEDKCYDTAYGPMYLTTLVERVCLLMVPFGAVMSFNSYSTDKNYEKHKNGKKIQLELLKEMIILFKQHIEELQKDQINSKNISDFYVSKVDDKKQLKSLRTLVELCYELGYNEKKYYKYYEKGKLDKRLSKYYTETEIKFIEDYFEEKGPTLQKNKK